MYHLHFVQGVNGAIFPRGQEVQDDLLDVWDGALEGGRPEGGLDQPPEPGVVGSLVEEQGVRADHPLLAERISRLEHVRSSRQDEPNRFRARYHHARAPQDVALEYVPVPFLPGGKEGVWIFGIELEGLADIRPAQRARRQPPALPASPPEDEDMNWQQEHEGKEEYTERLGQGWGR